MFGMLSHFIIFAASKLFSINLFRLELLGCDPMRPDTCIGLRLGAG